MSPRIEDNPVVNRLSAVPPSGLFKPDQLSVLPRQNFLNLLSDLCRELEFDPPRALRLYAKGTSSISDALQEEWAKTGNALGLLAPEEASQRIRAQIRRITQEDARHEALDGMVKHQRRSFFIRIARDTHNPHLAALVFSVEHWILSRKFSKGYCFTAKWLGQQIGVSERQAQELVRLAIQKNYLTGCRQSNWPLSSVAVVKSTRTPSAMAWAPGVGVDWLAPEAVGLVGHILSPFRQSTPAPAKGAYDTGEIFLGSLARPVPNR